MCDKEMIKAVGCIFYGVFKINLLTSTQAMQVSISLV